MVHTPGMHLTPLEHSAVADGTAAGLEPREDVSSPAAPCNTDTRSMDKVGGGLPRHHTINVVHGVYSAHGVQDTVEVGHVPHFENEA